jgi:hypothetical protein
MFKPGGFLKKVFGNPIKAVHKAVKGTAKMAGKVAGKATGGLTNKLPGAPKQEKKKVSNLAPRHVPGSRPPDMASRRIESRKMM